MRRIARFVKSLMLHIFATGFFDINTRSSEARIRGFMLFGAVLYPRFGRYAEKHDNDAKPTFYLKVNNYDSHAIICIQHWLDVITLAQSDFYFVCDNPFLKKQILKQCCFQNLDIKFLKSMRGRLRKTGKHLYTGNWGNAAYAHLTPFYHARDNGICSHWDIDADDMIVLLDDTKILDALNEAERHAESQDISAISLDVHNSRSEGVHWSLGILYINSNELFCEAFDSVESSDWMSEFEDYADELNLDWFLTHLRNEGSISITSFYINHAYFIHWGLFVLRPIGCGVYYWDDGLLYDPILYDVFGFKSLGERSMVDSYCVEVGLSGLEGPDYWLWHVWQIDKLPMTYRHLFGLDNI